MLEQNLNQTSSIGACWPPEPASYERMRGFYDRAIHTITDTEEFAEQFQHYAREARDQGLTRTTIRAIIDASIVHRIHDAGVHVEAAMPIAEHEGLWVAYMADNDQERTTNEETVLGHERRLAMRPRRQTRDMQSCNESLWLPEGIIHPRTSQALRMRQVPRFSELYRTFGYEEGEVVELLGNTNNVITYLEHDGRIVSTAMAEVGRIMIRGFGQLTIAEITEGITHEEFRRMGLYRRVTAALVRHITGQGPAAVPGLHVLFGECNLNMPGVLLAARENGRVFSGEATYRGRRLDLPTDQRFGMLEQNFRVEDGVETRPYNDFALSWVPLVGARGLMSVATQHTPGLQCIADDRI